MLEERSCKLCGASRAITIPFALTEKETRCASCGQTQWVKDYVPDGERMRALVGAMQAKQRDAALARSGTVACSNCGGEVTLPDEGRATFGCPWCKAELRVDAYLASEVIAAERLRDGIDALYARSRRTRRMTVLVAVGVAFAAILGVLVLLAVSRLP